MRSFRSTNNGALWYNKHLNKLFYSSIYTDLALQATQGHDEWKLGRGLIPINSLQSTTVACSFGFHARCRTQQKQTPRALVDFCFLFLATRAFLHWVWFLTSVDKKYTREIANFHFVGQMTSCSCGCVWIDIRLCTTCQKPFDDNCLDSDSACFGCAKEQAVWNHCCLGVLCACACGRVGDVYCIYCETVVSTACLGFRCCDHFGCYEPMLDCCCLVQDCLSMQRLFIINDCWVYVLVSYRRALLGDLRRLRAFLYFFFIWALGGNFLCKNS